MDQSLHLTLGVSVVPLEEGRGIKRETGSYKVINTETHKGDPHHLWKGGCGEGVGGEKTCPLPTRKDGSWTPERWAWLRGAFSFCPGPPTLESPHLKASYYRDHDGALNVNMGQELERQTEGVRRQPSPLGELRGEFKDGVGNTVTQVCTNAMGKWCLKYSWKPQAVPTAGGARG